MASVLTGISAVANVATIVKAGYSLRDRAHEKSAIKAHQRGVDNLTAGMDSLDAALPLLSNEVKHELCADYNKLHSDGDELEERIRDAKIKALQGTGNVFRRAGLKTDAKTYEKTTKKWETKAKKSSNLARSLQLVHPGPTDTRLSPQQDQAQINAEPPSYAESTGDENDSKYPLVANRPSTHEIHTATEDQGRCIPVQEEDLGLMRIPTVELDPWRGELGTLINIVDTSVAHNRS